jgi:predicted tellurium resistance membrane protein TerC
MIRLNCGALFMLELFCAEVLLALLTLTALEIVLGIDNIVFGIPLPFCRQPC